MLIIAIDFDGTIVQKNEDGDLTPRVLLPNAKEVINWIYKTNTVIIWTCRTDLIQVKDFLNSNGIKFHKINENADTLDFSTGRKVYADCYIDDRGIGIYKNIDWLSIKNFIKLLLKEQLINEIIKASNKK